MDEPLPPEPLPESHPYQPRSGCSRIRYPPNFVGPKEPFKTPQKKVHRRRKRGNGWPYGWKRKKMDGETFLIEDPKERAIMRRVLTMRLSGMSCQTIARTLNGEGVKDRGNRVWYGRRISCISQKAHLVYAKELGLPNYQDLQMTRCDNARLDTPVKEDLRPALPIKITGNWTSGRRLEIGGPHGHVWEEVPATMDIFEKIQTETEGRSVATMSGFCFVTALGWVYKGK